MPTFEIICLANSVKYGGRCIAGFKTNGSGWLRPISYQPNGTLFEEHYTLDNGHEPQLFDIIRIDCNKAIPTPHQPENWLVSYKKWQFVGVPTIKQLNYLLKDEINKIRKSSGLLGNQDYFFDCDLLKENPCEASLCLVRPQILQWEIRSHENHRKFRVIFTIQEIEYNLPITDPNWKELLHQLPDGEYSSIKLINELQLDNYNPNKFLFTISLSEPFSPKNDDHYYCYKLVAAVINSEYVKTIFQSI